MGCRENGLWLLDSLACKDEGPVFFKMYVITNTVTQLHFPEDLNPVKKIFLRNIIIIIIIIIMLLKG